MTGSYGRLLETRLRVVSWNVWWRYGDWVRRQRAIAATLAQIAPDVVALQEVWEEGARNLAGELAAELGFAHVYAARRVVDGVRFGNAVLSRWPIARRLSRALPPGDAEDEERLVLYARLAGPRGELPVFSTHLNWRRAHGHIRQRQVAEIARLVAEKGTGGYPPVVCGDFNAEPGADELRMLTGEAACVVPGLVFHDAWRCAGDGSPGYTWDNVNPNVAVELEPSRRIDYVLVGRPGAGGAGHVVRCDVVGNVPLDGVWPSDHFGVLAELRY